jgi:hypothetical protein
MKKSPKSTASYKNKSEMYSPKSWYLSTNSEKRTALKSRKIGRTSLRCKYLAKIWYEPVIKTFH